MLGVSNLYLSSNHDLEFHHEFTPSKTKAGEKRVQKMITFIKRHENPFHINQHVLVPELHHISTHEKATNQIRNQILEAPTIGYDRYIKRRGDRFVTKKNKDRISRANLKTMKYLHKTNHFKKSTTKKSTRKECGAIQKMVDIAKSRGYTMEELLAYDITGNSPLSGDDGFMLNQLLES